MKLCSKCRLPKATGEFYSDRSRRDGLSLRCKPCILKEREVYRAKNRARLQIQARVDRRRTPERGCWQAMIARCYDPKSDYFARYGGRGIKVCERWLNSFDAFREDIGPRPSAGHTVDRKDVNGDYEPSNCRWATQKEQMRNTSANRIIEAFGRSQCLAAWADEFGLPSGTLKDRLRLGWSPEEALSTPRFRKGQKRKDAA